MTEYDDFASPCEGSDCQGYVDALGAEIADLRRQLAAATEQRDHWRKMSGDRDEQILQMNADRAELHELYIAATERADRLQGERDRDETGRLRDNDLLRKQLEAQAEAHAKEIERLRGALEDARQLALDLADPALRPATAGDGGET